MEYLPLPSELKLARKQASLTQFELSHLSGVSQSVIAKIENGKVDPAYSTVVKLFSALEKTAKKVKSAGDVMHSPPVVVNGNDSLYLASVKMKRLGVSQLPVVFKKEVTGLICEQDVLTAIEKGLEIKKVKVSEVASPAPPIVNSITPASALPSILHYSPIVCIVDRGKLVGVVTRSDLLTVF